MAKLDIEKVVIKNSKINLSKSELKQLDNGIPVVIFATPTDTITIRSDGELTGLDKIQALHSREQRKLKETETPKKRKYTRTGKHTKVKREQAKKQAQENREKRDKLKGLESIVE